MSGDPVGQSKLSTCVVNSSSTYRSVHTINKETNIASTHKLNSSEVFKFLIHFKDFKKRRGWEGYDTESQFCSIAYLVQGETHLIEQGEAHSLRILAICDDHAAEAVVSYVHMTQVFWEKGGCH